MLDTLIINGEYPDYNNNLIKKANIGINKGKISYIGNQQLEAKKTIDANHRIVSPGFIDIHMHEENFEADGERYIIAEKMLKMGVTTACGGNCGLQNQELSRFKKTLQLLGGAPLNYVMLVGYNQMRYRLNLGHDEKVSKKQSMELLELVKKELEEGAFGISFGIEYDPGMTFDEMVEVVSLLKDERQIAAAHFRESGDAGIAAIQEMADICDKMVGKFQVSHLSSCCAMGQMKEALELINSIIEKNPRFNYDTYPYNAFSTLIGSAVFEEESLNAWCKDIGEIMLTQEPYKNVFCTKEILEKARLEYPNMMAVGFIMDEDEITAAIRNKYGMIASDGILNNGNGHPRAAGTFPRLLGKYVREDKALELIDALRKITKEPAIRLSLNNKGSIEIGNDADITIFDQETILDGATYDDINISPKGIDYVIIAGEIAIDHNIIKNDRLGSYIDFKDI